MIVRRSIFLSYIVLLLSCFSWAEQRLNLADWQVQSSAVATQDGATISEHSYDAKRWLHATLPATVLAAQVENKIYPDPYFGMNLRSIPGTSYEIGTMFARLPMPDDSPYKRPWWYRTEFTVPPTMHGKDLVLHFDGINYRANIWLNGKQIANSDDVAGAYRTFEFDITSNIAPGKNVLAVQIFASTEKDLAINWVDWNPTPPDKNMGLWRPVWISASTSAAIRNPQVISKVDPQTLAAELTVTAEITNLKTQPTTATLKGAIGTLTFERALKLAPREAQLITFSPADTPQLKLRNPKLWWPWQMGEPNLEHLKLQLASGARLLDDQEVTFGIREVTSELTDKGYRLFKINGKPILIRGGGWAPDMLLRSSPKRTRDELELAKHMGLNTIRLEGKLESDEFYDLADRMGMLIMPGWCCCDIWEVWRQWGDEQKKVAIESLRSQAVRMRNHPSIYVWVNGSDNPPVPEIEQAYLDVLKQTNWPNPVLSSATAKPTQVTGMNGVKMSGPYDYVPPEYWLVDNGRFGGAYGYNTETSPGPAVPSVESLKRFLPQSSWWPIDDVWNYHAGGGKFINIDLFTAGMNTRYGPAKSMEEYSLKSQAMTYDGERAMFEAYSRNKYTSTGVIQWMLNNAWPSIIWHLYDYYLYPAGGYFGTKKATEPLHVMYSYDDHSIAVINSNYAPARGLKVTARVLNFDMTEKFTKDATIDIAADGVVKAFTLPPIEGLTTTYFVKLTLIDSDGKTLSDNFYWLSTKPVQFDWEKSVYYTTPTTQDADMTMLNTLPRVELTSTARIEHHSGEMLATVTLRNASKTLAFMTHLRLRKGTTGDDALPVFWDDNYISLLPGEERVITGRVATRDLDGASPSIYVEGWNIEPKTIHASAGVSK
jgi:exo-1,4-beta-D-glucosaminidase